MPLNKNNEYYKEDFDVIYKEMQEVFRKVFGEKINLDPSSQLGRLALNLAKIEDDRDAKTLDAFNLFDANNLSGYLLDKVASFKSLNRVLPKKATFKVKVIGDGVEIKEGDVLLRKSDLQKFISKEKIVSDTNGAVMNVESENAGNITVNIGDEFDLEFINNKLQSIKAITKGVGTRRESDVEFKSRIENLKFGKKQTPNQLQTILKEYCKDVRVFQNKSSHDNKGFPSGTIKIVAYDIFDTNDFCTAILNNTEIALGTVGSVEKEVMDDNGDKQKICYDDAVIKNIVIDLKVKSKENRQVMDSDVIKIKEAIFDYYNNRSTNIGNDIYESDIADIIHDTCLSAFIFDLKVYFQGDSQIENKNLIIENSEVGIILLNNINVSKL